MDKKHFLPPFAIKEIPEWRCPFCKTGELIRITGDFITRTTQESYHKQLIDDDDFDEFNVGREELHAAIFTCHSNKCNEIVASIGLIKTEKRYHEVDFLDDNDENFTVSRFYYPKFFHPNLEIFEIPSKCPPKVADALNESFKLYFSSPKACANQARIAIEELLNALKVKKIQKNKKGKLNKLSLHARIDSIQGKYSSLKKLFIAIKWLGNAGSHSKGELTYTDLLKAYDMLEHILTEIYNPRLKQLNAEALKINKKKGP